VKEEIGIKEWEEYFRRLLGEVGEGVLMKGGRGKAGGK